MREDWIECKIKDVGDISSGGTPSTTVSEYWDGEISWISPSDLTGYKEKFISKGKKSITLNGLNKSSARLIPAGSVLFSSRAPIGYVVIAKNELATNQGFKNVSPSKVVDTDFLYHFLKNSKQVAEKVATGTTFKEISKDAFGKLSFPLPPLPEQRAIVKKLEGLFSSLDAGVADLKKAQQQLKIYKQAVLKKAFEGELTKEWRSKLKNFISNDRLLLEIEEKRNLSHLSEKGNIDALMKKWEENGRIGKRPSALRKLKYFDNEIQSENSSSFLFEKIGNIYDVFIGSTPSRSKPEFWLNGTINWVSSGEVSFNQIDKTKELISEIGYINCSTIIHPKGTVILAMIGEGKTRGQAAILNIPACHNQNTAAIRQVPGLTIPEYLYYFLLFNYEKNRKVGSGNNQKALNQEIINNMIIPFCSLEEQAEIVKDVQNRFSIVEILAKDISISISKAEALRQSILKKAFEGKLLTEQELAECKHSADYEPASLLLERIKTEQNILIAKPSKKKAIKPIVVAEQEVPIIKVSADLHAGLIAKIIKIHEENPTLIENLSHIKCEKIAHLVEYHLQIPLGRQPVKDAAGPDDYPHLKKIEHRARMANYFDVEKQPIGYSYSSAKNSDKAIDKLQATISDEKNKQLGDLISLFLNFDLEVAEIIATTYAGWNNLILIGNVNPSDEEIVFESRENWSERKLTIDRERFFKAINWMRKNELVPTGYGAIVPFPRKKK